MNTNLRRNGKKKNLKINKADLKRDFFILMKYEIFLKKFPSTKFSSESLLAIEMEKMWILMNKLVYLGLSIL